MPWTVNDVDSHKKGLTAKQKKRWVEIANAALKACQDKGESEETCAASAIRQANGVVNNSMETLIHVNIKAENYQIIRRKYEGKDYMIVPVTMMVEGVHNGNHGPIFHDINELGKIPASWNGIPIVINHPEKAGIAISANSPEVLEESAVGKVFGTFVDEAKLKAKAWLDEERLKEKEPNLYEGVCEGKSIEVSVGVFTEDEEEEGDWNGEHYVRIATNHRPDHLALLPDAVGACSIADGCGLCVNQESIDTLCSVRKAGYGLYVIGNHKATGYREKMDAVYATLRGMDKNDTYHYLEEMYDSNLIYSKSTKDGVKMYKQDYSFESGKVELTGNPVEVRRKVDYVVNLVNNQKKEDNMSKNECPKCVEKVNALITNKESGWTEDDREWLSTLTEPQLDKVAPKVIEKTVEKTIEVNKLAPEDVAALAFGKKQLAERRDNWIKEIQANTDKVWTDEKLNKMDDETLEGVYKSVYKEEIHDYSLKGGVIRNNVQGEVEPMAPTGVVFDEPKK